MKQLNLRREKDMLVHQIDKSTTELNDIKWMINFDIAKTNLEIQVEALNAQKTEYERQKERNDSEIDTLESLNKNLESQIEQSNNSETNLESQITILKKRQEDIFNARRKSWL